MKKIMFSDKFRLTQAVLDGRKTQTRRIVKDVNLIQYLNELEEFGTLNDIRGDIVALDNALYEVGEIVAIAQRYSDIENLPFDRKYDIERGGKERAGWNNKMYVEAMYMPHRIRITNVRIERLQDCSCEDCIAEGIVHEIRRLNNGDEIVAYKFENEAHSFVFFKG